MSCLRQALSRRGESSEAFLFEILLACLVRGIQEDRGKIQMGNIRYDKEDHQRGQFSDWEYSECKSMGLGNHKIV